MKNILVSLLCLVICVVADRPVHLIYMTHLDVGFTDTARKVCDRYFDVYFPAAIKTAEELRGSCNSSECPVFRWTQFSWMVSEYLDGLAGCSHRSRTPYEIRMMEAAIRRGDIVWHANPLSMYNELLDPPLLQFGLNISKDLRAKFGQSKPLAAKLSDVTGISRSAVPLLVGAGVRLLHIGYNTVGGLPIVANGTKFANGSSFCGNDTGCPERASFRWRSPSGEELVTLIEQGYGDRIEIPSPSGPPHVLRFLYIPDNSGPPTAAQVRSKWSSLQQEFPGRQVLASTLDDFAAEVLADEAALERMPVVTKELGDAWLYGTASDPMKLALFREARRAMREATQAGNIDSLSWQYQSLRRLLKVPEHNWGMEVTACKDCELNTTDIGTTWTNAGFAEAAASAEFTRFPCRRADAHESWNDTCGYGPMEQEWRAEREFNFPLPSWASERKVSLDGEAQWLAFTSKLDARLLPIRTAALPTPGKCSGTLSVSREGIVGLDLGGRQWADAKHILGQIRYVTYSVADFQHFSDVWSQRCNIGFKYGMESAAPESRTWVPSSSTVLSKSSCHAVVVHTMPEEAHLRYGAPQTITVSFTLVGDHVDVAVQWRNKTATRLAESLWFSFNPRVESLPRWSFDVLGQMIDPQDVVERGTRFLHAVNDGGVAVHDGDQSLQIEMFDTPLVAPGDIHHLLDFSNRGSQPDPRTGVHVNLHNNIWNTAFPMWYSDDGLARFRLSAPTKLK